MEILFAKKKPLQDLLSSLNAAISTNESTWFITGHVIYNLAYTYKFQLKTTLLVGYGFALSLVSHYQRCKNFDKGLFQIAS